MPAAACSASTSVSRSSTLYCSPSSISAAEEASEKLAGEDRMMRLEIEAAEALASLALWGAREVRAGVCETDGRKGKRASQRVNTQSPATDSGTGHCSAKPRPSDLVWDQASVRKLHPKTMCKNVFAKSVEAVREIEILKPLSSNTPNNASRHSGKSRNNLTVADNEAPRSLRVLANRESARQTIRRRQVLCELLSQKAADLAWENEHLKKEKDLALRKFHCLKSTNEGLKAKVSMAVKVKVEDDPVELKVSTKSMEAPDIETPTSTIAFPLFLYNHTTLSPSPWPSQMVTPIPSPLISGPGVPLYALAFPWSFLPETKDKPHVCPINPNDREDETPVSSRSIAHLEDSHLSPPTSIKTEALSLTDATSTDRTLQTQFVLQVPFNPVDSCRRKLGGAVAAAEARKRRRELTKLKSSLHGRRYRMRC